MGNATRETLLDRRPLLLDCKEEWQAFWLKEEPPRAFMPGSVSQSNPQVAGSAHPIYEWQTINVFLNTGMTPVLGFLAILPLLGMLIILATSVAALFQPPLPKLVLLKRIAAGWGLAFQLVFDALIFLIFLPAYARTDIAWGFVVVLLGFSISVIGTFFVKSY